MSTQNDFTDKHADEVWRGIIEDRQAEGGNPADGGFEPFEPFEPPNTSKLPPFPMPCLPDTLRNMAQAAADNIQVAPDMTAVCGLTICALCVQNKFIINPKPGWVEPLNLFSTLIAPPSDRKTPAISVMSRRVHIHEKEENENRAPLIEEYKMKRDVLTKKISNYKELAAKPSQSSGKSVSFDDITELQYQLADLDREAVKPLRLLADDATPEALASLMASNDGKIAILSDEGGIYDIVSGRYNPGKINMDVFLKAYAGSFLRVDRQGRPSEVIEHPTLTMLLMVQPIVLETIMSNREFAGRGFLARQLYSLPVSRVGHRSYDTPPIPPEVEAAYNNMLEHLLSIPDLGEARVITLSPEAHKMAREFFEDLEPRLLDDLENMDGWAGKYHGQVMRIAGILHCCQCGQNAAQVPVSAKTMRAAQTIGTYFLCHAKAAFRLMGLAETTEQRDARYILKRLEGQTETSKRDLFQLCNGRFGRVENMEPGLMELVHRGYIRIERAKTGGRPTEKIYVNPISKGSKGSEGGAA